MTVKTYTVWYRLSNGKEIVVPFVDHLPQLGTVVRIPGSEQYGEVFGIERTKPVTSPHRSCY